MGEKNLFTCSSRIAMIYGMAGIEIIPRIHFSQIEPHHFAESENFEFSRKWMKELKKEKNNLESTFSN
jgi:hypothetical protein